MRNYFVSYIYSYKEFTQWYNNNYGNNIISYPYKVCTKEHIEDLEKLIIEHIRKQCCVNKVSVTVLYFKEVYDE